ncbi:hypothetical protein ACTMU2_13410 [Cupriavidus basilensis]
MGRLFRARHAIEPFLFCWKAALRNSFSVAFHPSKEEENSGGDDLRRLLIEILSMGAPEGGYRTDFYVLYAAACNEAASVLLITKDQAGSQCRCGSWEEYHRELQLLTKQSNH